MTVLAIDTSTEILSVALRTGSHTFAAYRDAGLRHTPVLMPLIDSLLAEAGVAPAEIDLVACMRGPGSFTGLRIGMASAKGLAEAIAARAEHAQAPLVSVPTFDAMASGIAPVGAIVIPVIDGRKGRFYGAGFATTGGIVERTTDDLDLAPGELLDAVRRSAEARGYGAPEPVLVTGPHAKLFSASLDGAVVVDPRARRPWALSLLDAAELWHAAHGYDAPGRGPHYVRASDAELSSGGS